MHQVQRLESVPDNLIKSQHLTGCLECLFPGPFYLEEFDEAVDVEGSAPDVERGEVLEGGEVGELADLALVHEHDVPDVRAVPAHQRHLLARVEPVLLRGPEMNAFS